MRIVLLIIGIVLVVSGAILLILPSTSFQRYTEVESQDQYYRSSQFIRNLYLEKGVRYRVIVSTQISTPTNSDSVEIMNVARGNTVFGPQRIYDGENVVEFETPYLGYYDIGVYIDWFDYSRISVQKIDQFIPANSFQAIGIATLALGLIAVSASVVKSPNRPQESRVGTMRVSVGKCEYENEKRCNAIAEYEETRIARSESCENTDKSACCKFCQNKDGCQVSCDYMNEREI